MKNYTREKMLNKEKTIGSFFSLGSANAIEALGYSGLDYVIIDTEHGPFVEESVCELIRAAKLSKLSPIVRIKEITRSAVLRMLDIGAEGLIVPNVKTIDEVKNLVEWGKYFPLGKRGFYFGRAAGYGYENFSSPLDTYFDKCNSETMIIPQCETVECLENIEEIVGIEGVDAIFVGPYDLSISMGIPGQFDTDEFKAALDKVLRACRAADKPIIIYASDLNRAIKNFEMGFDSITLSSDIKVLVEGYIKLINELKSK